MKRITWIEWNKTHETKVYPSDELINRVLKEAQDKELSNKELDKIVREHEPKWKKRRNHDQNIRY